MKIHRYRYLYVPMSRYFERFSPQSQLIMLAVKIAVALALVGAEFARVNALI